MNPALQGYTAAVLETVEGDALSRLADELGAVDRLLATNQHLYAALTDTAMSGASRRGVVEDLLAERVSAPARRLVAFAAGNVPAQEVPNAVTWLALRSSQVAEGRHLEEPALGHAAARARVGSYATALFEDLPTDRLEEIEDELFRFARTVEATPALRSALIDANLPVEVRQAVVDQLLDGKVQPATLRLVRFVLDAGRTRDFVGSLDWLVQRTAEARGWRVARVRAALELESTQRERLEATLGRMTGSPVELQITLDPHLLGGAVIEIGDLLVDATARGRLDSLREHLLPEGWDDTGFGRRARGAEQNAQVDAHEEGAD